MSDTEDAARYRWLKTQFTLSSEGREHQEFVRQKGDETTFRSVIEYWHHYQLKDDWRFGAHTKDKSAPSFDYLVDQAMEQS